MKRIIGCIELPGDSVRQNAATARAPMMPRPLLLVMIWASINDCSSRILNPLCGYAKMFGLYARLAKSRTGKSRSMRLVLATNFLMHFS
jgi:hypothetical protein